MKYSFQCLFDMKITFFYSFDKEIWKKLTLCFLEYVSLHRQFAH